MDLHATELKFMIHYGYCILSTHLITKYHHNSIKLLVLASRLEVRDGFLSNR